MFWTLDKYNHQYTGNHSDQARKIEPMDHHQSTQQSEAAVAAAANLSTSPKRKNENDGMVHSKRFHGFNIDVDANDELDTMISIDNGMDGLKGPSLAPAREDSLAENGGLDTSIFEGSFLTGV
jgi:hypothetical protein